MTEIQTAKLPGNYFVDHSDAYDNQKKNSGEAMESAARFAEEFHSITPGPFGFRIFDGGTGDGTILADTLSHAHRHFSNDVPFQVVGKEVSVEHVWFALQKMPAQFCEHPATALVLTNLPYATAPRLRPRNPDAEAKMIWNHVKLTGTTTSEFRAQINDLQGFLAENWQAYLTEKGLTPDKQVALVISRADAPSALSVPQRNPEIEPMYDVMMLSQAWRSRAGAEGKARIVAPLAESLAPGGRLVGIQASGDNSSMEIIHELFPGENPYPVSCEQVMEATRTKLGPLAEEFTFNAGRSFKYYLHDFFVAGDNGKGPNLSAPLERQTAKVAFYVAQMADDQVQKIPGRQCEQVVKETMRRHGGKVSFSNDTFTIIRNYSDLAL